MPSTTLPEDERMDMLERQKIYDYVYEDIVS